jgi:hypothetical protein
VEILVNSGGAMQVPVVSVAKLWAYSNQPFRNPEQGAPDVQLVGSEFCAAAIREESNQQKRVS